ncbi:MAG: hypothetical protein OXG44_21965, partial [Gammaproteobacteria bacterium]|nr:hypothetical protein [Gammaproteobacteria bacterium]
IQVTPSSLRILATYSTLFMRAPASQTRHITRPTLGAALDGAFAELTTRGNSEPVCHRVAA